MLRFINRVAALSMVILVGFVCQEALSVCIPCQTSTTTGSVAYKDSWIFRWDPNNGQEIGRSSSLQLRVLGGHGPYRWSVSGTGFWFDEDRTGTSVKTTSRIATLYSDASACGSAAITVKDSRDKEVTGSVRCLEGTWVIANSSRALASGRWQWYQLYGGTGTYFYVEGRYKVLQSTVQIPQYGPSVRKCDLGEDLLSCAADIACQNPLEVVCGDYYELWSQGQWPHCYLNEGSYINERCTSRIMTYDWRCQ